MAMGFRNLPCGQQHQEMTILIKNWALIKVQLRWELWWRWRWQWMCGEVKGCAAQMERPCRRGSLGTSSVNSRLQRDYIGVRKCIMAQYAS